ncbi:glycoside hydrolase family 3 protein [Cytobacillus sp. IB215665]|uniref:glycoside hydrolase family 3 protein n=1 Tax=Cytobacillus sp. IB215665 TaxID=3097357 RepID=UPI002A1727E7|nr:glycoside hydrolase family 3 protein [Cytobacillus sp. IB215665]MDX8365472.1 glycoside hydrolase family 3 protein [Cytobacillus sp. IB215665]
MKKKPLIISVFLIIIVTVVGIIIVKYDGQTEQPAQKKVVYLDPEALIEDRVQDLLSKMTVEEKVGQLIQAEEKSVTKDDVKDYYLGSILNGGGSFPELNVEESSTRELWEEMVDSYQDGALATRLGIPLIYGVDAVHGHNNVKGATIFPHSVGLGSTRNIDLIREIGKATAKEIKSSGPNWTFAPTVASVQDIRWGRSYEGFGENATLVADMGVAYIEGFQGTSISDLKQTSKVVATAKHFIGEGYTDGGKNQGDITQYTEEEIIEMDKEIYEKAVKAGVRTVMASFHSIQGLKMHANERLLTGFLKDELGFDGFVISDWYGIQQITIDHNGNSVSGLKEQIKVSVNAGVDMLMQPENWRETFKLTLQLVNDNEITMERLDDAVSRILRVKFEAGLFENPKTDQSLADSFGSEEHQSLARQAVSESLVLLKNDEVNGQPIFNQLPEMDKIFVAGKNADDIGNQSGGWTITWQGESGDITDGTTIVEGIKEVASNKTVTYDVNGKGAAGYDVALVVIGEEPYAETDGDTNDLNLKQVDLETIQNIRTEDPNIPIIVILVAGRPMIVTEQMDDWSGLVAAWLPGTEGAGVADVLFGDKDFTGKLPISWPTHLDAYDNRDKFDEYILFDYGFGLSKSEVTP